MILAGDVGGTKTNLALVSGGEGALQITKVRSFESQRYPGLEAIIQDFLLGVQATIDRACIGVAGPVLDGAATGTNLPWRMSEESLRHLLGTARVRLVNDLQALAYAVPLMREPDLVVLQEGIVQAGGAKVILAPGTGLGEGYLTWDGERYRAGTSEGGHTDFAPSGELQTRLLEYLRQEYGHVSWERVLSGPGLHNIYRFLVATGEGEPEWVAQRLASGDASAAISALALEGTHRPCRQALDIFVSILGAQAGNVALTFMATGGVYLAGGIPPKILPSLQEGGLFLSAFRDKGRLSGLMEHFPVYVIRNVQAPLVGAASCALAL